jgi:phenylalanyl-tRNA synthetase alpha chain
LEEQMSTLIPADAYGRSLSLRDLTDAAYGPHAMQLLLADVVRALCEAWSCELIVYRGSPVVSLRDNYELLGYAADAAARDARYTRYLSPDTILRTHTSAMIPGLLRTVAPAGYADVLLVCPGLVYRRDRIDRLSVGEPHQLDLWRIARTHLDDDRLHEMVELVVRAALPEHTYRALPALHPYTVNGLEVEVRDRARWIEIAECGLAAPDVLRSGGLTGDYHGLAMGLGLDRLLMVRKTIDDIRLLRSEDERVAAQMLDLSRYRPVSTQPPVRRDLSLAVRVTVDAEELGDRVRSALGERSNTVEAITVLSDTPRDELPPQAAARIGLQPDQKNLLVRVVLRHPTRTLSDGEANELRDVIYAALHEGNVHQWAVRP